MSGPTLLPYLFKRAGRHNLVQMIDPERFDWSQGFFKLALPGDHPADGLVPFDDWLEAQGAHEGNFDNVSAIFHVSRCGSTLLSQNIKATNQAFVLSEPPFFRILRHQMDGTIDYETAVRACLAMLQAWRRWALTRAPRLLVKFNSQLHLDHRALFEGMPGAKFLFLYREPLSVLESLDRGTPSYLRREAAQGRIELIKEFAEIVADPIVLAGANRYCTALEIFSSITRDDLLKIEYPDLPGQYSKILRHLGFDETTAPAWSAKHNAKSDQRDGPKPYQPVSPERLAQFANNNTKLLAIAERHFRRFRAEPAQALAFAGHEAT